MKNVTYSVIGIVVVSIAVGYQVRSKPSSPIQATSPKSIGASYTLKRIPSSAVHHGHMGAPNIRLFDSTSANWSGYAVPASSHITFNDVSGSWIVPAATGYGTAGATYSSAWVGIDGDGTTTVEQIGTEQDWTGSAASYYAWYEMYPQFAYEIVNFPVGPGDVITAEVKCAAQKGSRKQVFTLDLQNVTQSKSFSIQLNSSNARLGSAEWVMEAPSSGGVLPLADFGTIAFSDCYANTQPISYYANLGLDPMTMVGGTRRNFYNKAVPSTVDGTSEGFTVTWYNQ
jgi:hypothetical protein